MGWGIAILVVSGALVVWGAIAAHRAAKARQAALAALARQWGVRFSPRVQRDPIHRFPGHDWFEQGEDQWLSNVLAGDAELAGRSVTVDAGDFTYQTSSTDAKGNRTTTTHCCSYFVVDLGMPTPNLAVRPEGFGDKLKGLFGFRDLEFESAAFNSKFHVRASDKKFAYDVCHARAQESLMQAQFTAFALVDGRLLVPGDRQWSPEQFVQARAFAAALLAAWPAFVWEDLAAAPRAEQTQD